MTMTQIETATFLVGKEGLDAKTAFVPTVGFHQKVQIGDQDQRLFPGGLPDNRYQNRTVLTGSEADLGQFDTVAWLQEQVRWLEPFARFGQQHVFGRAANIIPAQVLQGRKQLHSIELAIAQEDNGAFCGK